MLEAVAKALYKMSNSEFAWEETIEGVRVGYRIRAQIAIEAMCKYLEEENK